MRQRSPGRDQQRGCSGKYPGREEILKVMLALYETAAGYALFKVLKDEDKMLGDTDAVARTFESAKTAKDAIRLEAFLRFESMAKALKSIVGLQDGKLDKGLKRFLREHLEGDQKLIVSDSKLGASIVRKFKDTEILTDAHGAAINELYRGIRTQLTQLLGTEGDVEEADLRSMALGLSHSLSRFHIKFSADKVDTMVIQAVALLDDLDKELNIYAMRLKEWYGWHFPELARIVVDSVAYARIVTTAGLRTSISSTDLSMVLPEALEREVRAAAEISMGTEISDEDLLNIEHLAHQVVSVAAYRAELADYLRNRMTAIAPNLTALVGDLVGARLVSRAGSLLGLAKCAASTVQILGAEKALFRALKTKHDTPKYGLIYHAALVGQAAPKLKGKISRLLASKCSLAVRVDAFGEKEALAEPAPDASDDDEHMSVSNGEAPEGALGMAARAKVEARLRELEASVSKPKKMAGGAPVSKRPFGNPAGAKRPGAYNAGADFGGAKRGRF